jgi:hypothetical protein
MPKEIINKSDNLQEIYYTDLDNKRQLCYLIDKNNSIITFFTHNKFFLPEIYIEGFKNIPPEFSNYGGIKAGTLYYLNSRLSNPKTSKFTISKNKKNSYRKINGKYHVVMNYSDFRRLKKLLSDSFNEGKFDRNQITSEFFHSVYPRRFKFTMQDTSRRRATKVIENLDSSIIKHLEKDDVDTILNFVESLLNTKYKSTIYKRQLLNNTKIRVDEIAINNIILEFERMMSQDLVESKWGDFLRKNLFLLDSKYVNFIPQLNVICANARLVDFALVDYDGCLDIFEIKRPSTPLLAKNDDRGNYYWSTDAIKAIVQAEKYQYNAETHSNLEKDISREYNLNVKVQRPRAILLIGNTNTLEYKMKEDFRILRMSLKNVEVVPFNELLERLKNLKNKVYIE